MHRDQKMLIHLQKDGATRVSYPLKGLSKKESKMIEKGVKNLMVDIKLGKELGKKYVDGA